MTEKTLELLKIRYKAANDENKPDILFGSEVLVSRALIDFLIEIVSNKDEYDLARIEAIKAVGLAGINVPSHQKKVVDALIKVANEDEDYDIQSYSLQALCWYPNFAEIPAAISSLLSQDTYIVVRDAAVATLLSQNITPKLIGFYEI